MIPIARARLIPRITALCAGVWLAPPHYGAAANPFAVDGGRPARITVTIPGVAPDPALGDLPEMPRRLAGVLAVLVDEPLREALGSGATPTRLAPPTRHAPLTRGAPPASAEGGSLFEVHLHGRGAVSTLEARPSGEERIELRPAQGSAALVHADQFRRALGLGALYTGSFQDEDTPRERVLPLSGAAGRLWTVDSRVLRARLFRSAPTVDSAHIAPAGARFAFRLPRDFDPRSPPGLIVWCSPADPWSVPDEMHRALDAHNLIAIGALDAGNERPVPDRVQLALDAATTAMSRWPIDLDRVYAVGMSGGAKIALLVWAGWPEVFDGAMPIVAMASFRAEPAGPGQAYPALFSKPTGATMRLLKERRVAAVTGPPDFNYDSVVKMAAGLAREGLPVRLFDHPDMGHTMPTPARFDEALRWIDEPAQSRRAESIAAAQSALEAARAVTPPDRAALLRAMELAPWTAPAWEAWELFSALPRDRPAP